MNDKYIENTDEYLKYQKNFGQQQLKNMVGVIVGMKPISEGQAMLGETMSKEYIERVIADHVCPYINESLCEKNPNLKQKGGFNEKQLFYIFKGIISGLSKNEILLYAVPEFSSTCMSEILELLKYYNEICLNLEKQAIKYCGEKANIDIVDSNYPTCLISKKYQNIYLVLSKYLKNNKQDSKLILLNNILEDYKNICLEIINFEYQFIKQLPNQKITRLKYMDSIEDIERYRKLPEKDIKFFTFGEIFK